MRRDGTEAKRIDQLLIKHMAIPPETSIGRKLEDWDPAQLLAPPDLTEEQEVNHYRALLQTAQHGKPYDSVAIKMLLSGFPCERIRTIYKELPGIAAIRLPKVTVGSPNSPDEDRAFSIAERLAMKNRSLFNYSDNHAECFAPLLDFYDRKLQQTAEANGETAQSLQSRMVMQVLFVWFGGEIWSTLPLVAGVIGTPHLDAQRKDIEIEEVWNLMATMCFQIVKPPAVHDYVENVSTSDLARDAARAQFTVTGVRREGQTWPDEVADLIAFLMTPCMGLYWSNFPNIIREISQRMNLGLDAAAEEELAQLDMDEILKGYAKGELPPTP